MTKAAVISNEFVRDTQVFTGNPKAENWEDGFSDVKSPQLFIGFFDGNNDKEICREAARYANVHSDTITLLDIPQNSSGR